MKQRHQALALVVLPKKLVIKRRHFFSGSLPVVQVAANRWTMTTVVFMMVSTQT